MISAKDFIKQTTTIPSAFINELFEFYDENTLQTDMIINLDHVAKWLVVAKKRLIKTLNETYKKNIDYSIESAPNPNKTFYGSNNYKKVMLTPDCFKLLCMMSKSKNADQVRRYFIEIESIYIKYRQQLLDGIEIDIKRLETNQRGHVKVPIEGYLYIMKASDTNDSVIKFGKTKNLNNRLDDYQTGKADDIELLYKYKSDDIDFVESCVKNLLKGQRYRKYREVYKIDVDIIKKLIHGCEQVQRMRTIYVSRKAPRLTGGYYAVFSKKLN